MRIFCLLLAFVGLAVGCSREPDTSKVSGEVRMRLPWADDQGEIRLQEISLSGVENLLEMRGAFAHFLFAPKIHDDGLQGEVARARFLRNQDGVYIPSDFLSQQMATLYAHFERLSALDRQAGVGNLLHWPRQVGLAVRLRRIGSDDLWTDNAFYDGGSDAVLVVATERDDLPLALNPGVIGHEHFHALFYHLVLGKLVRDGLVSKTMAGTTHGDESFRLSISEKAGAPKKGELEKEPKDLIKLQRAVFLKAVNEGLADVWGWIYSGQTDFIGRSLPQYRQMRDLKPQRGAMNKAPALMTNAAFRETFRRWRNGSINSEESLNNLSYFMGTDFSRAVRGWFLARDEDVDQNPQARLKLARRLIERLPELSQLLRDDEKLEKIGFDSVLEVFQREDNKP